MFDVAPTELIVLGTVALLVIPPKDLPRAMRTAGYWIGRARGVARQFRSGFDTMVRDAELAEMEKRWKAENERIMREHPATRSGDDAPGDPAGTGHAAEPALVAKPEVHTPAAEVAQDAGVPAVVPADPAATPAADGKAPS